MGCENEAPVGMLKLFHCRFGLLLTDVTSPTVEVLVQ